MPFAQYHAPHENEQHFEERFPADFICEALDQTRGWFYSLLGVGVLTRGQNSFGNVLVNGTVLDKDGKKMSKSLGNATAPVPLFDRFGADAVRWYVVSSSSIGNDYRYSDDQVRDVTAGFMRMLWNTYSFFVTYANLDGFDPGAIASASEAPLLDRWLRSELAALVDKATAELEAFDATTAARDIEAFVGDLSNWYVRRSRRRFWKSESDQDKLSAYQTLHQALLTISKLLAPFIPFSAEELYRNLSRGTADAVDSVHLAPWPAADHALIDRELSREMARARRVVEQGHRARDVSQQKVRQPLAGAVVPGPPLSSELEAVVLDELNLKSLSYGAEDARDVILDTVVTPELRVEGLARELVRRIQEARKQAGFNIEDRIEVYYHAGAELGSAFEQWSARIADETLAVVMTPTAATEMPADLSQSTQKVDGQDLVLGLRRVAR
jgi:isoleucyl-tRNA synthetase